MANEKFTQLPVVASAANSDIICAVQGGISVQETMTQVSNLVFSNIVLSNAGNPNGSVAGAFKQILWDTTNNFLWICSTAGSATTAVWKPCIGAATNGQLPIGNTGNAPTLAQLTAGSGISIANGSGVISISATGLTFPYNEITGVSTSMTANAGYIANNAARVSLLLPAVSTIGDRVELLGKGAGGWKITQGAGQQIRVGANASTAGAAGYIQSTNQYDSITLVCIEANLTWSALSAPQGSITTA